MSPSKILTILHVSTALATSAISHHSSCNNPWTILTPLPRPREGHGTVTLNDTTIAIIGGALPIYGNDSLSTQIGLRTTDSVELYDIPSNTWTSAAPAPIKVNHPNVAVLGGKLYLLGGLIDPNDGQNRKWKWSATGESYVYDPNCNTWTALEPMKEGTERGDAVVGVHEDVMYLAGGMTYLTHEGEDAVATVTAYNTTSGTWCDGPELPEGRTHAVGGVFEDVLYVIGGRAEPNKVSRGTVYKLDVDNPDAGWCASPNEMPVPRAELAGAAIGGRFYTFGGAGDPNATNGVFSQVETLNMEDRTWMEEPAMPVPRHSLRATVVGNRIFLPGGALLEHGLDVDVGGTTQHLYTTDISTAYEVW